jgi:hypothetical protein
VVGASRCVRGPLEVNGKGIRGAGVVAGKEAYMVHAVNIIYQWLYFVACYLIFYICNVFGLHSIYAFFFLIPAS